MTLWIIGGILLWLGILSVGVGGHLQSDGFDVPGRNTIWLGTALVAFGAVCWRLA